MARTYNPEADAIIDKEYKVLDKGFIRLVDYLGGDDRIVQSARVSYGEGTKSFREDAGLIDYLLRNEHTSPFEQVILTFHCKMPIFVARQWVRHRTARLNEISGRYSVLKDEFYVPDGDHIAMQSADNKQGRNTEPVSVALQAQVIEKFKSDQSSAYGSYEELLELGIARELARVNLPVSSYTEWYWQIDLHNLFHFLRLRMDHHAQYEIRAYADLMYEIASKVSPKAVASFDKHLRTGLKFSGPELEIIGPILQEYLAKHEQELIDKAKSNGMNQREIDRLIIKIKEQKQT